MSTCLSRSRADSYSVAYRHYARLGVDARSFDEGLDAAMKAMNSVARFVRSARLRVQFTPGGRETIVAVTKTGVKRLPAVDWFLQFVDITDAVDFLGRTTGVAFVANRLSDDSPF